MKPWLTLLATLTVAATARAAAIPPSTSRNVQVLGNRNEFAVPPTGAPWAYSACWAYVHGDGREYALLGVASGTAIYNITDPANPNRVAFIPGPVSGWREMKSYRNWVYVTTEGLGPGQGLQIIRMTDPEHPLLVGIYSRGFARSHTVQVDTARALLICNGTRDAQSNPAGMRILSLADPEAPFELAHWPADSLLPCRPTYIHDCVIRGTTLYGASIYSVWMRAFDLTDPAHPNEIASWTWPGAVAPHSSWPDTSGAFVYVASEFNGQPLRAFDVRDPLRPVEVSETTCNPQAIVHNPRVDGDDLYLANYTEGVRVLDISDRTHPAEYAWLDTYPGPSGGFSGIWDVCPYLPSGNVIASDMETGLWVFRPQRNYGIVDVRVLDGEDRPVPGATIALQPSGDAVLTGGDGRQRLAPSPGIYRVMASRYGDHPDSALVVLTAGSTHEVTLRLLPRWRIAYSGVVRDLRSGSPLAGAEVALRDAPLRAVTGPDGAFRLEQVPGDLYRIEVRRTGYATVVASRSLGPQDLAEDFALLPARTWDPLENAEGWTATTGTALSGAWVHGTPIGVAAAAPRARPAHDEPAVPPPGQVTPLEDHSPDPDSLCFITGQAPDTASLSTDALSHGTTTLISPPYDVSGLRDPRIGYWCWCYSWLGDTGRPDADDWLAVSIRGDAGDWTVVDTVRGSDQGWQGREIRLGDRLPPGTRSVRLRFVAAELGLRSIARMAVDDVSVWDQADPRAPDAATPARLTLDPPWPNPAAGPVLLELELPERAPLDLRVLDVAGRTVRILHRGPADAGRLPVRWDGLDEHGRGVPAGLYFARASDGRNEATARVVRIP